jgi:hypothetical protein
MAMTAWSAGLEKVNLPLRSRRIASAQWQSRQRACCLEHGTAGMLRKLHLRSDDRSPGRPQYPNCLVPLVAPAAALTRPGGVDARRTSIASPP